MTARETANGISAIAKRITNKVWLSTDQAMTLARDIDAALIAERRAGVGVKGLEWRKWRHDERFSSAKGIVGEYTIIEGRWWLQDQSPATQCADDDAAKAAAQADFESRILSALVPVEDRFEAGRRAGLEDAAANVGDLIDALKRVLAGEEGNHSLRAQIATLGSVRASILSLSPAPDTDGAGVRIVAAAIRYGDIVACVPRPGRHHHIINSVFRDFRRQTGGDDEQGFLTSEGCFVDRHEALKIADRAGQIIEKGGNPHQLFSEDVWETPAPPSTPKETT